MPRTPTEAEAHSAPRRSLLWSPLSPGRLRHISPLAETENPYPQLWAFKTLPELTVARIELPETVIQIHGWHLTPSEISSLARKTGTFDTQLRATCRHDRRKTVLLNVVYLWKMAS
jgi:hypothetical protein